MNEQEILKENVERVLSNFSRVPLFNTTMTSKEVNYLFDRFDNTVFCNGMLREIKADALTSEIFKVYTVKF